MRLGYTDEQLEIVLPRQKELYEAVNPETRRGAIGNGRKKSCQIGDSSCVPTDRFTKERAKKTGMSERKIQRLTRIGEKLGKTVLDRVRGTSIYPQFGKLPNWRVAK